MSKCRAVPLELGEPYVAFFRSRTKFLASLVCVNWDKISASVSGLFTDQGQVENVRDVAAVEYFQEDVHGKFGESTGGIWLTALRHRVR